MKWLFGLFSSGATSRDELEIIKTDEELNLEKQATEELNLKKQAIESLSSVTSMGDREFSDFIVRQTELTPSIWNSYDWCYRIEVELNRRLLLKLTT